jgi:hypothetical protein
VNKKTSALKYCTYVQNFTVQYHLTYAEIVHGDGILNSNLQVDIVKFISMVLHNQASKNEINKKYYFILLNFGQRGDKIKRLQQSETFTVPCELVLKLYTLFVSIKSS